MAAPCLVVTPGGSTHEPVRRHGDFFRVAAEDAGPRHLVADLHAGHAGANCDDRACAFLPESTRERYLVEAAALIRVDEVEAGGLDLDDGFARLRDGIGHVFVLEHFRTADLMDANSFHGADYTVSALPDVAQVSAVRCSAGL